MAIPSRVRSSAVGPSPPVSRTVFVRFTADWCVTCKVNESVVLEHESVKRAFLQHDVKRLSGDWTLRDETIRAELERHGRAGVPLYLVYDPDHPDRPTLLPELLTRARVIDELQTAAHGRDKGA